MNEANKVKLGAFILISVILLLAAFLAAGALRIFAPRIHAMTEVYTSVEGLGVGSPVKYLGMAIGKITAMHMRSSDGQIVIFFDIFGETFKDDIDPGDSDGVFDQRDLDNLIRKGSLSCLVNASGLMGGSHLELVRGKDFSYRIPKGEIPSGVSFIPSSPSHIGNAIQNVSRMLEDMKSINWNEFAVKVNNSLDQLNTLMGKSHLEQGLERMENISKNLEDATLRLQQVLTQQNVDGINNSLANLNQSTKNLLDVTKDQHIEQTMKSLNVFLVQASALASAAEKNSAGLRTEMSVFLRQLESSLIGIENTLSGLNRIVKDFNRDPAQAVQGHREPAVR